MSSRLFFFPVLLIWMKASIVPPLLAIKCNSKSIHTNHPSITVKCSAAGKKINWMKTWTGEDSLVYSGAGGGNKCKTHHSSKSLDTVSPAGKWRRSSTRHFHAPGLYDHIHSYDLSLHIKQHNMSPASFPALLPIHKCCCPRSLQALFIIDQAICLPGR